MAKKFGKFVLFTAAVAAAGAGVYYYLKNKETLSSDFDDADEDYDDFSEDMDTDANRSYVALNHDENNIPASEADASFEKLSSIASNAAESAEEKVEEFFDEDDEISEEK